MEYHAGVFSRINPAAWLFAMHRRVPPLLTVVPLLWAATGGSAAFLLGMRADLALLVAGLALTDVESREALKRLTGDATKLMSQIHKIKLAYLANCLPSNTRVFVASKLQGSGRRPSLDVNAFSILAG